MEWTIRPGAFRRLWEVGGDFVVTADCRDLPMRPETATFLQVGGLPDSACPFLGFEDLAKPGPVRASDCYQRLSPKQFGRYVVIGHEGHCDPICVDLDADDQIVGLNHDRQWERYFINTSVSHLAAVLLARRGLQDRLLAEVCEADRRANRLPAPLIDAFEAEVGRIDAVALDPESFWGREVHGLRTPDR